MKNDSHTLTVDEAAESRSVPVLRDVWKALSQHRKLADIADVHRGIEWQAQIPDDQRYVDVARPGFHRGYARADTECLLQYSAPATAFLNVQNQGPRGEADQEYPWNLPKVLVNAVRFTRKSRWRHAAFLDDEGLICSGDFLGVWPKGTSTTIEILAAILNGPIAAAFVNAYEGLNRNTNDVLMEVPLPQLSDADRRALSSLVRTYLMSSGRSQGAASEKYGEAKKILLLIDGIILKGYDLPPHLERKLLDIFEESERPLPFTFTGYDLKSFLPVRILVAVDNPEKQWQLLNERRIEFIDREAEGGLNANEEDELERIQKETGRYLNITEPLPFDMLERFEERARSAGVSLEQEEVRRP